MLLKSVVRDLVLEYSNGRKIGEILVDMGFITKKDVEKALEIKKQKPPDVYIGQILIETGVITEHDLDRALKIQLGPGISSLLTETSDEDILNKCPNFGLSKELIVERFTKKYGLKYVDLSKFKITETMLNSLFNTDVLKKNNVILYEVNTAENLWRFASGDITDTNSFKSRARAEGLRKGIKCEFDFAFDFEIKNRFEHLDKDTDVAIASTNEEVSGGAVELVDNIIIEGINKGSSDIHIEPKINGLRVRYRIDGLISYNEVYGVENSYVKNIISRIKVMSNMDVAVSRKPQDGIIKDFTLNNKKYDLRVSSIQVVRGETIVIRISPKDDTIKTFEELGFFENDIQKLNNIIDKTNGIFFIAGATGSGKTTTLYSIIDKLNSPNKNICTIEDPVEREIENINQVQVTSQDGTTSMKYADYLRAFLRQDPDIIIVGETRDKETAETSMRASLTGHFVVSTIHANNALETISRMYDMNIDTFILSATLEGLMSQRLVRKICPKCVRERALNDEEKIYLDYLNRQIGQNIELKLLKEGEGCPFCNNTGYKGRIVVAEIIAIDNEIRRLVSIKAPISEIEKYLKGTNHISMTFSGLKRVLDGTTTLQELKRIL